MTSRQRIITKFSETNITVEEIAHEIMLPVPTTLNILHGKDMAELFYDKAYNAIIKLENQPNVVEHPALSYDDYKKLRSTWVRRLHRARVNLEEFRNRTNQHNRSESGHETHGLLRGQVSHYEDMIDAMDEVFGLPYQQNIQNLTDEV